MKYILIAIAVIVPAVVLNVAIGEWTEGKWSVLARAFVGSTATLAASFWVRKVAGLPVDGIIKVIPMFAAMFVAAGLAYVLLV